MNKQKEETWENLMYQVHLTKKGFSSSSDSSSNEMNVSVKNRNIMNKIMDKLEVIELKLLNSKFFNDGIPILLLICLFFIVIIAIIGFIKMSFF